MSEAIQRIIDDEKNVDLFFNHGHKYTNIMVTGQEEHTMTVFNPLNATVEILLKHNVSAIVLKD